MRDFIVWFKVAGCTQYRVAVKVRARDIPHAKQLAGDALRNAVVDMVTDPDKAR